MESTSKSADSLVVDSNEAVEFKLIREASDIDNNSLIFKPVMSHQIFGAQETIFGYKNLKVSIYFSAAQLNPYLNISYSKKIDPKSHDSVEADNIHGILTEKLEIKFTQNLDDFIHSLDKEVKFKPPGELKESFTIEDEDPKSIDGAIREREFELYYCEVTTPGLIKYHQRLQTFILWYIDAASFIDTDDEKWKFFLL